MGPALSTNSRKIPFISVPGSMSQLALALKEKLVEKPSFKVVAMPDFFLDYVLAFPGKLDQMTGTMVSVAGRGGGNLLCWVDIVGRGGGSSDFLAHLSRLWANDVHT